MRNGKLSKTDRRTLWRAAEILNAYCDWANDHGGGITDHGDEPEAYSFASNAAGGINNFLFEVRLEG